MIGVIGWLRHLVLRVRLWHATRKERRALEAVKPVGRQTLDDITMGKHDDRHR